MELKQLRQFLAVMEEGNFASAARATNLTPQAIGQSIDKLQSELGVSLFERKQRNMVPTEFAFALENHARRMMVQHRAAVEELGAMDSGTRGEVRVAFGGTLAGEVGPLAITRFQEKYPLIDVTMTGGLTDVLIEQLRRGDLDLVAGVATPDWRIDSELQLENLFRVRTIVLARKGHPLDGVQNVTLKQLAEYPWLVPARQPGDTGPLPVSEVFVAAGLKPPQQMVFSNAVSGSMGLLVRGDYLTVSVPYAVPLTIVAPPGGDAPLKWLDFEWPTAANMACLIYRAGVELARPPRLLAEEIRQAAHELYDTDTRVAQDRGFVHDDD